MLSISRLTIRDRQGTAERIADPSLVDVRARLLEVIRSKPVVVPVPVQPDLFDERAWRRNSRRVQTQRFLDRCGRSGTADIATVTGVSPRAVNYWRRGTVAPTAKHYRQLMALQTLLERVQQLALAHASSY